MIEAFAPGKLFIAGEYAVVEPNYSAIIVAVNRFITISLEKGFKGGSIQNSNKTVFWTRKENGIVLEWEDSGFSYIISAINITEEFIREKGIKLNFYNIKIESELESEDGKKYGLGSSAAIVVATVKALLKHYNIETTEMEIFKLAALASLNINPKGSCGDIAASAYGGWLAYKSFNRDWVIEEMGKNTINSLLQKNWPGLDIERLFPSEDLRLVIGWTGMPASTINLLKIMKDNALNKERIYNEFLSNSEKCVQNMVNAFKIGDIEEIQRQISINRNLLYNLGKAFNIEIETPKLNKLCNISLKHGGTAKSSGAGGGDCGIAIFKKHKDIGKLIDEWIIEGIKYLPFEVYENKIKL